MIYVFRLKCGLVKIGRSKQPLERLRFLSSMFRENLEPVGLMDGGGKEEAALHRQFGAQWAATVEGCGRASRLLLALASWTVVAAGHDVSRARADL